MNSEPEDQSQPKPTNAVPDFFADSAQPPEGGFFDDGFDLEKLSDEFDEKIAAADPFQERPNVEQTSDAEDLDEEYFDVNPTSILEAMLFVGNSENRAITAKETSALMRGVTEDDIAELVADLNESYRSDGTPFLIVTRNGGYQMTVSKQYENCRNGFYREEKAARLSQAVIDVLALVAYLQPITKIKIEEKRLKPCGSILNQLVRRQLIFIERHKNKSGKSEPAYQTTDRFLEVFGLNSLDELPKSQAFDA